MSEDAVAGRQMPAGLEFDSAQSYAAFALVKFVGYSLSALFFNARYPDAKANPLLFGVTRTLLGMLLGAAAGLAGLVALELTTIVFLFGLVPFRIFEWLSTLWLFYRRDARFNGTVWQNTALGILWSFVLDIPAIFGFLVTRGFWIC